jgi:hypothetical protein
MSAKFLYAVERFLKSLESTQNDLLAVYSRKRDALRGARADELGELSQAEEMLTKRLQALIEQRAQILQHARTAGLAGESMLELVESIGGDRQPALTARIEQSRELSSRLRFESWIHWIVAHRAYNHCTEMLDIIAHCGRTSPTYQTGPNQERTGSAILDASI